ncbi:MAG: hypothetical protein K2W95_19465 [Candidatus Obscuribacterales bacterium]|nr:hypothetical protein [Candidatus Obscuribacterales bacterium]
MNSNLDPTNPCVNVLYRDNHLLAVAKPSGLVVHRGFATDALTLADIARDQITGGPVHAIHRLDRGTSGVVLFALDTNTAREIQRQMAEGRFEKRYLALVRGPMSFSGTLDHPVRDRQTKERLDAITEFKPLAHSGRCRTHQIRLHLKHLSHPIVGDVRYGKGDVNRFFRETYSFHRMALHACEVKIEHPSKGPLTLTAPVPSELFRIFEALNFRV